MSLHAVKGEEPGELVNLLLMRVFKITTIISNIASNNSTRVTHVQQ